MIRVAKCFMIDRWNRIVKDEGEPVIVHREIPDLAPDKLKEWAKSECLKFKEWWPKENENEKD